MSKAKIVKTPLHQQIANVLRSEIRKRCEPGDRFGGDKKLAHRFGVSSVTIREAVLILCQEGLLQRRRGSGTFVASPPLPKEMMGLGERHIAVLLDKDISHPMFSYCHGRVSERLLHLFEMQGLPAKRYTGRHLPWQHDGEPTCPHFLAAVEADLVSAAVLLETRAHASWSETLRSRAVPVIGGFGDTTHVLPDYGGMVRQAVDHLYERGRRRIAMLGWLDPATVEQYGHGVHEAFHERMRELGLPIRPEWIRHDIDPGFVGAGWEQFREMWSAFADKPDGLIVTDDVLFRDAASAILQLSINVPDQLAIVTHANRGSGMFYPLPTTRMEIDPDDIADVLANLTLSQLGDQKGDEVDTRLACRWEFDDGVGSSPAAPAIPAASDRVQSLRTGTGAPAQENTKLEKSQS